MSARRITILTGTRAEYGLLRTVIRACEARSDLETHVIVTGSHLLGPAYTVEEVERECAHTHRVVMQHDGELGRMHDARALGRGIAGVTDVLDAIEPECVLVLGDRIEAFAGACAASVGGIVCAHIHGGDRAEGVADEAMRHAITKLAHLHLPATEQSAGRITRMGEDEWRVRAVGSPAIDGLDAIEPMTIEVIREISDGSLDELDAVFLLHPTGDTEAREYDLASVALAALSGSRVLCLSPNHDPGRAGIVRAIDAACDTHRSFVRRDHLDRTLFIALLKRLACQGGVLVGNSSAGLIECAAIGLGVLNLGDRQGGREYGKNVLHECDISADVLRSACDRARVRSGTSTDHPYGCGDTGVRSAELLATLDFEDRRWLHKRSTY